MRHHNKFSISSAKFWDILLAAAFLGILLFIIRHPLRANHDVALYLHAGQMLTEGKTLYVDIFDLNPPLITYLCAIPALIGRLFSINIITAFSLLILSLIIWSALVIRNLVLTSDKDFDRRELGLVLIFWAMFSLFLGSHFGQREQLFVLMSFPFFILRWLRWEDKKIRSSTLVITSVLAGIGASLKPQFIFILFVPEIYRVISQRKISRLFKPETFIFAMVIMIYVAHFFFLPEKMLAAYFHRWIPFMGRTYSPFDVKFSYKHGLIAVVALLASLLPFLVKLPDWEHGFGNLDRSLALFTMASMVNYFSQHRWIYHLIPALYGIVLIYLITIIKAIKYVSAPPLTSEEIRFSQKNIRWLILGMILSVAAALPLTWKLFWKDPLCSSSIESSPMVKIISAYSQEGDPVLVISTDTATAYPLLVQMNRRAGSRYLHSFPIGIFHGKDKPDAAGEFQYSIGSQNPADEIQFLNELAEDIAEIRPPLILISDRTTARCPDGFNVLQYLTKIGFTEKAMGKYKLLSTPETNGTASTKQRVSAFILNW